MRHKHMSMLDFNINPGSTHYRTLRAAALAMIALLCLIAASCGDSTEGDDDIKLSDGYVLGGMVTGLNGTLVIQNDGADDITMKENGLFVFETLVANGATYEVTVKEEPGMQLCPVTNPSGTMTIAGVSNVSIACKSWGVPLASWDNISPLGSNATNPAVSVDSAGGAVVIWQQPDNSGISSIYVATLSAGVWSTPASRSNAISPSGTAAESPVVDMGPQGVAVAAWLQPSASGFKRVYASTLASGLWSIPVPINPDGSDASNVSASMDDTGNAVVSWQQSDSGAISRVFASTMTSAWAWTHPSSLTDSLSSSASNASAPHSAIAGGKAIVTWQQADSAGNTQIFKAEHSAGTWALPTGLSDNLSPSGTDASAPKVAMASAQSALIVWLQKDDTSMDSVMHAYLSGSLWDTPDGMLDAINPPGTAASGLRVSMGATASAIVVWQQPTSDGADGVFAAVMKNWSWVSRPASNADSVSPSGTAASEPDVAMDSHGKAVAVWKQLNSGGVYRILKAEYNDKWHSPTTSDTTYNLSPSDTAAALPRIAMNAITQAIGVWQQSDGSNTRIFKAQLGY